MKNVFVFPCGSEIGLEINRALSNSTFFRLFGGSSVDDHGRFVYKNYIDNVPRVDNNSFIEKLNAILVKHKIDFIVPAHDSVVLKLVENRDSIKATVIAPDLTTCKICRSKGETYEVFNKILATPKIFAQDDQLSYPVFLKPDIGQGSKGTYKVNSKEELDFYISKDPTVLIMEYLPGKEYTVDCFTDRNGKVLFAEGRQRVRISNGISVNSKRVLNPDFAKLAKQINQEVSLRGAWFYQVKERLSGELVLMEIAPRIAGTMSLFRSFGINFIQLSLFDRMGVDVGIIMNDFEVEIDRALISRYSINVDYKYIYVDFDDTLIVHNQVNTEVLKLLYQAKNMGKKNILITKHQDDLESTMSNYAISNLLFDEIILLDKSEKKSTYIKNSDSIFIDDSYSERKEVFDSLKIPVFGLDAIESLLNWKS